MRTFLLMLVAIGAVVVTGAASGNTFVSASASVGASGTITAHLTQTSFTAAQAGYVTLSFKYSSASARLGYTLARKNGSSWVTVRSVNDMNGMEGANNTRTISQLFGLSAAKIGQYRLKLFSDESDLTLSFTVVKPPTLIRGEPTPRAGHWTGSTTASNFSPSSVAFYATPDHRGVIKFSFSYNISVPTHPPALPGFCSVFGKGVLQSKPTVITAKSFKATGNLTTGGTFSISGTFASPISARGMVGLQGIPASTDCGGAVSVGPVSWSATWENARQPSS
jgi:hypothetical protein